MGFAIPKPRVWSMSNPFQKAAETVTPHQAAVRAPGRAVSLDLAISLTSADLTLLTRSKEIHPGGSIAVSPAGATLALGDEAREMEGRVPPHIRVLQPLLGGRVSDDQLALRVLEHALKRGGFAGPMGPRVLLAVPDSLTESERRSLTEAARSAGARHVRLISQSLAAAVGAGVPVLQARGSLIVDLDASSGEAALISYGRVLQSRPLQASRYHFQMAVCDAIRRDRHVQISLKAADALLTELGETNPTDPFRTASVGGRDLAEGLPRRIEVSVQEVFGAIQPLLDGLQKELRAMIAQIPAPLLGDLVKEGLVLTGRGAQLRGLVGFVTEHTRLNAVLADEPEFTGKRGLQRILKDDCVRRALLGEVQKVVSRSPLSPARTTAAAVVLLGLACTFVGAMPMASTSAQVETALDSTLSPLWKVASRPLSMGPKTEVAPVAPITAEERRRAQQLEAENKRLRTLMKLKAAPYAKGNSQAARVIAREPQGWLSSLVLDVGSKNGLKPGLPVISSEGLLGSVQQVNGSSARVRVLTHSKSAVAASIPARKASGVLYGKNQKLGELRFVDPDKKVKVGDKVVTSGLDGRFPPGIPLGTVVRLKTPQDNVYSTVLVQPAASADSTEVLVLKP